jgi:glutathionylspermidine synthase
MKRSQSLSLLMLASIGASAFALAKRDPSQREESALVYVRQGLANLARFGGRHAVIGSWIVGDEPAGICVREAEGPITTNRSRFVPHTVLE